jgi:ribonuclease HI
VAALVPWLREGFLTSGVRMGEVIHRKVITSDASLTGWGATLEGRTARGLWGPDLQDRHINFLELMAVFLALKHFEQRILGWHVLIRTDNTTTMCYFNKQGGLRSRALDALARELTLWCFSRLRSVRASHVPGLLNSGADLLSRGEPRYENWSLCPSVARQIWDRFGHPVVDLFASPENTKCPLFFALSGNPPLGLDALSHDWPRGLLFAFPPLNLILPTLERVRRFGLEMLLVAPRQGVWIALIAPLLCGKPWQLPLVRDLLSQAGREIFHQDPQLLDLWVWPLRGRS